MYINLYEWVPDLKSSLNDATMLQRGAHLLCLPSQYLALTLQKTDHLVFDLYLIFSVVDIKGHF